MGQYQKRYWPGTFEESWLSTLRLTIIALLTRRVGNHGLYFLTTFIIKEGNYFLQPYLTLKL